MKSSQFTFLSLENQNGEKASEKGNTLEKTFSRVHLKGNNTEENEHRRSLTFLILVFGIMKEVNFARIGQLVQKRPPG